jgi:hypothetical protein
MNWAVVNESGEVLTIVTAPQGKLPPGCKYVPESELPANAKRAPQPPVDPTLEEKIKRLETAIEKAGIKINP